MSDSTAVQQQFWSRGKQFPPSTTTTTSSSSETEQQHQQQHTQRGGGGGGRKQGRRRRRGVGGDIQQQQERRRRQEEEFQRNYGYYSTSSPFLLPSSSSSNLISASSSSYSSSLLSVSWWTIRDSADQMLISRHDLVANNNNNNENNSKTVTNTNTADQDDSNNNSDMYLAQLPSSSTSSSTNLTTLSSSSSSTTPTSGGSGGGGSNSIVKWETMDISLRILSSTKLDIVRHAFNAAATVVLDALRKQQEQGQGGLEEDDHDDDDDPMSSSGRSNNNTTSTNTTRDADNITKKQQGEQGDDGGVLMIPQALIQYQQLDLLRIQCMERARENKEYAKRRGGKVDNTIVSSSNSASTLQNPNRTTSKNNNNNNNNNDASAAAITTTGVVRGNSNATVVGDGSVNMKTPSKNSTTTTTDLDERTRSDNVVVSMSSPTKVLSSPPETTSSSVISLQQGSSSSSSSNSKVQQQESTSSSSSGPKFTRNTPASSAAALDFRFTSSRAILCVAGNMVFDALTPSPIPGRVMDVVDVPQNPAFTNKISSSTAGGGNNTTTADTTTSSTSTTTATSVNMGAVVVEAQTLAQRTISLVENAVRRSTLRYQYRKDNARYDKDDRDNDNIFLQIENPFSYKEDKDRKKKKDGKRGAAGSSSSSSSSLRKKNRKGTTTTSPFGGFDDDDEDEDNDDDDDEDNVNSNVGNDDDNDDDDDEDGTPPSSIPHNPNPDSMTTVWQNTCLDRFLSVLKIGAGHAIYYDVQWNTRHGRIANLLQKLSTTLTSHDNDTTTTCSMSDDDGLVGGGGNFGPHLIVTTSPEIVKYTQEFYDITSRLRLLLTNHSRSLYALPYHGNKKYRRKLRQLYFSSTSSTPQSVGGQQGYGLLESLFHVVITSYDIFLEDYIHFCQIPYQVVILDESLSWMSIAQVDPSSPIGTIWDTGIFSSSDKFTGLAGTNNHFIASSTTTSTSSSTSSGTAAAAGATSTTNNGTNGSGGGGSTAGCGDATEWDFTKDGDNIPESIVKEAWVGLTARHRIMTTPTFSIVQHHHHNNRTSTGGGGGSSSSLSNQRSNNNSNNSNLDLAPVGGLVSFCLPHFYHVAREEWDRSRISSDQSSMRHFRQLVARSTVVHNDSHDDDYDNNNHRVDDGGFALSMQALTGQLRPSDRYGEPNVPRIISDDEFVSSGKIAYSRRSSLAWLGIQHDTSWLRYELGQDKTIMRRILDYMKLSNHYGHLCEEITTSSSMTTSGFTGQVVGTMAYRLACCCNRHFSSEQGLRQHISSNHAPPGTWLCRTCGNDCITSQARTHHERSCGQPSSGVGADGGVAGATPTVGQGGSGKGGVGKKNKGGRSGASQQGGATAEEKDPDGSLRVPGYRGVWVNKEGKHFVKIDGKRLTTNPDSDTVLLFDNSDDAARKHDELARKQKKKNQKLELNFKPDGSRIVYEDITPATTSGLGGSAASVVPALSVINIKDLPPDVKPLLRDPRQTSRTGGNSKRHVYAYRGVCRQARKGHDRWQSQISFMGVNHYLGTFDSEWDAAAIYAWAHLILYGEEATQQAQKEGEEAAAAYEQEKRDIAAGKIPEPPPKPEKKRSSKAKTSSNSNSGGEAGGGKDDAAASEGRGGDASGGTETTKKRKAAPKDNAGSDKKAKTTSKTDKDGLGPTLGKGATKAPSLAPREIFEATSDTELMNMAAQRLVIRRNAVYGTNGSQLSLPAAADSLRPCIPWSSASSREPLAAAVLLGLPPTSFEWDLQEFLESSQSLSEQEAMMAIQHLAVDYDEDGVNEKFRTALQGTVCILGRASEKTQQLYKLLGLGAVPLGGAVGNLDCHLGGVPGSCSERAACIRYVPTDVSDFQIFCMSSDDVVTVNGKRLLPEIGSYPLRHLDVCSVGARVFAFLLPTHS